MCDRVSDPARRVAASGYGCQLAVFPSSHGVLVLFGNDQDFITDPVAGALLAAAEAP